MKDKRKMDANKVWQWRIMRVKKYSRRPQPFYHSNRIGLDFNVASSTKKKLDLQLVTNGVILEVCDFAKTVNKSKSYFITNILENNFDLGLENEQQRCDFTARILHKVKDLIRKPPKDKNEVFTLFDTSSKPEFNSNDGLNMASTELTESFLVEMDDTDDSELEDEFKCSQATSKEYIKTERLSEEIGGAHGDDSEHGDELKCSETQSAGELKEDVLPPSFPYCEEIGLYLDVGSKQSLDPGLLTKGVMLELVHLSRILTASYSPIVLGVLEHNFELDLKSQQGKSRVWFKISQLLKRRKQCITTGSKISPEFKNEQFSFHTNPFKRTRGSALSNMEAPQYQFKEVTKRRQSDLKCKQKKRFLLTTSERANKRCRRRQSKDMETNALSHHTDLSTSRTAEGDHCHTCPQGEYDLDSNTGNEGDMEQEEMETENNHIRLLGESDLDSDKVTDSGNSSNREHLVSSSLPTVNSNVNLPYASQPDKRGLGGGEEQTQSSKHSPNKYDMDQEEMGKNNNMWKLRANRVNQILSPLEFGPFNWSKKIGLDFNVGFGPKQNISIDSLLDSALLEVAKFALAMNSSQQNFIMEILEYNFDFDLQSEYQSNVVPCEVMNRVRQLKECEDAVKFSKKVFELPGFMPSINITNPSMGNVKEECDDVPVCPPHSHAETKEHISQKSVDLYPFCKEIGLKLHVNSSRPNKKLDINKLTNGAMTEVTNFAEELCGTFEQICLDILGHNFDLDLQSGDSDLARNILARIPAIVDQRNLSNCVGTEGKLKGPRMVKLDCQNNRNVGACSDDSPQAGLIHQDISSSTDTEYQNEDNLKLWQLRANHIQQILSIPHEEHCPFYSYSRCKKLGIDFNVGFGAKQNLDPKLLTNGIMAELNTFATTMLSAQKYFITDILECNFDLDLKNELYRSAFAQQTLHRVRTLNTRKKYSKPRINNIFELPDMRSIQKSTIYCPKCYQDRNHKLRQDESDPGHMHHPCPHTMTDAVSADANCTAQKSAKDPSSTFSAIEETLMDSYPCCKKIGLKLCVDKDQRKDKLDMHLLTRGVMNEVIRFTKKLCGTKIKIVNDVLEHNFNIGMQGREISPAALFQRVTGQNNGPAWFSEVFVVHQYTRRAPGYVSKVKRGAAMHQSEWQEVVKKRQLSLRAKEERATLSSHNISVGKSKTNPQSKGNCFPIFKGISLDRDMTSKSGKKEQLDLKLLTRPVCDMEQEEIRAENYYTCPLAESNLDSDKVTDSEDAGNQDHLQNPKRCSLSSDIPRESESSYLGVCAPFLPTTDVSSSLPTVNPNVNPPFARQPDERGLCGSEEQTQSSRHSPNKYDMDQEEMGTNNNMWKLRANRVNQILSALEFGPFNWSKKNGLDFNVGFGPKQNISIDSLLDSALLEVAKFALAMNSSQQNFIMEILEYNFDFDLQSEYQRNVVPCEVLNRVRQLKECEDAVKFSKEVFELPGFMPSINITNPSMGNVKEECDDVPVCPPHSHAETEEHISQKSVDLYPFCKEIGLKLHINSSRPNKKLDINKLTNGAMTEVTNFAEELCGTFEQICLDILGHNFDLDLQSGDSDLARNILARIPAIVDQRNLSNCAGTEGKVKSPRMVKLDCQNNRNVGACSADSPQPGLIHQDISSSTDTEYQNEDNLKLWQLRANHIQQILSIPHEEHCPFYSYYRCKKLGIDFNVGFGAKQNLDPKLLTNGIMAELNTFATTMLSAQKYFITDILECNFDLDLKNELYRSAFAQQTLHRVRTLNTRKKYSKPRINNIFELPDMRSIQKSTIYCPKCYQDRNHKLRQDESDPGHMHHPCPHTMTDAVSADANCTAQKSAKDPSSTFSAIEETLMDSYPCCKKIGLKLCVDKDQRKDKLDMHLLTRGVMNEVIRFTKKLCGTKIKIVNDVLEHNFNIGMQGREISPAALFQRVTGQNNGPAWFSEVFVVHQYTRRAPGYVSKVKRGAAMHQSEWQEVVKKRQLSLRAKEERATLSSHNISVGKSKTNPQSKGNCFPIFKGISLDRDMTSKSGKKEQLDLKLLTRPVCDMEQEEIRAENYYTCPLAESNLDSDKVTDSEDAGNQDHLQNPKRCSLSSDIPRESESSYLGVCAPFLPTTDVSSSLPTVNPNVNPPFARQTDERGLCGSEEQTQSSRHSPNKYDMDQEEMGTNNNMWKLRANRVNQILSALEFRPFYWSKKNGLDFNVGFGPKQNISIDSLLDSALLEVAKFALAMNSSQQNFIMEILEYNFDFDLQSEYQRNVVPCEVLNRVRQLKECEDAVKFSKEVFELPGFMPSINITNPSMGNVKEECDDVPVCPPHSHAETEEHISQKSVDLYPFCKEIGLKLHINSSRPNKKLDINKLTNGAMTEVTNFAEELCGTFEQICLDILGHNFDLDLQSGDSDLARNILARIPAIVDQRNLSNCAGTEGKVKSPRMVKLYCQNNLNVGACNARSSQAGIIHQDVSSSTDIEYQNEDNLKLWQLRANHIQQILSIPHEEHCPFYSYSKCKKLGIDFNVGFGAKQNLDPKLLTNGIMVELNTFATALLSAQKYFITDILECNFDLDLKNELYRSAFAQQTINKVQALNAHKKYSKPLINKPFELPDMRSIQKGTTYCPKCYQDRNHKLRQDESDPDHMHHPCPHTMTDAVSADANCTAQKSAKDPSSNFLAIEETLMDSYPRCKKIGLKLCVAGDQRKDKLDMHLLTRGVMNEVISFTKKLCGTKIKIVNDVLEHNFNIGMQGREISPAALFQRVTKQNNGPAWFSEVLVIQQYTRRGPGYVSKEKRAAAIHQSERQEAVKKRQLSLRAKEERATLSSHNISVGKSMTNPQSKGNCFPIIKGICLDRDMTSKSVKKEQLDLKVFTRPMRDMEQEEIRAENYYTCPLGESDLDSDEVTDSEDAGNQDHLQNPTCFPLSSDIPRESESSYLGVCAPFLSSTDVSSSLPTVNSNVNLPFASQPDERGLCGSEEQTQTPGNASNECDMDQEEMGTENNMWKLRANRVNQILSALEFGPFNWSKKIGLDFNVGFGPKQNISIDSLLDSALLEVAKFALAMNSSQQNFIMEILEYNFDFYLQSEYQSNVVPCEVMNRVRQLKECEDAVKFSKEVFELPGFMPSINITNPSMGSVKEECDDVPVCPPLSHADTKGHISQKSVDRYPFCKEIGLKLHVNSGRPNKKLDINKLTNGAVTEVTNFAEELCGTFEQICLDILGHNFDLDLQSGDSDLARNILERIPAVMEQRNLKTCVKVRKKLKGLRKDSSTKVELDCKNNPHLDACSSGSSQAAIIAQDVSNSPDIEHQNELDSKLWKLRANHIQQILSIPHEEHCPLYSYTRCKKLGIDFNVGSGVKQNLDPKLLTNGIMVELNAFATALLSAQKYFITEILEYNFHLDFNNEQHRSVFAQQTMDKVKTQVMPKRNSRFRMKLPFELPDTSCIQEPTHERTKYCPKCYQDRNHKLRQDESDPGHMHHPRPHTMTDAVSADANCTAQKPAMDLSSTFSTIEKTIMDSYPLCKKIGLNLCVDKDQPKDKLDNYVLTRGVMNEVARFAKRLCSTKSRIIHTVLEHNFNIGMQGRDVDIAQLFRRATLLNDGGLAWFSEAFEFEFFQPVSHRQPGHVSKLKQAGAMHRSERKETIKKRQLALQAKEERDTLPSHNTSVERKSKRNPRGKVPVNCYPICTEIGLDLDVTPKSREKEKLDLKLLTKAVVFEIHKFAAKKTGCYLPHTVFDILDFNFDLSSQHHRRWEFCIATTSKIRSMVKNYRNVRSRSDEVFKLPFVFDRKDSQSFAEERQSKKRSKHSREEPDKKRSKGNFVRQVRCHSDVNRVYFLDGVKTNEEAWCHDEDTKFPTDPGMMVQMNGNLLHVGCGSPLQGNLQIKEEYDLRSGNMTTEPDVKTVSNTEGAKHLVPGEPTGPFGYTLWQNSERQKSANESVQYYFVTEPQGSAVYPNTASNLKTEQHTEGIKYLVPVEAAGSEEYSMVIIGQGDEST